MHRLFRLPMLLILLVLSLSACTAGPAQTVADVALPPPEQGILRTGAGDHRLGTLLIDRQIAVGANGTVREVRRFLATDSFARLYREHADAVTAAGRAGWELTTGEENGRYVIAMVKEYKDFETFNQQQTGTLERMDHPLYEVILYRDTLAAPSLPVGAIFPPTVDGTPEQWTAFLEQAVHLSYRVTLPSEVTSHAMDAAEGSTARWEHALGDLAGAGVELRAQAKVYKRWPVYTAIGVLAGIVALVLIIRATRPYWDADGVQTGE